MMLVDVLISGRFPVAIPVLSLLFLVFIYRRSTPRLKSPPGPRGYPFVGNLFQLTDRPHVIFPEWSRTYGNMVRFSVFSFQTIIVNKLSIASDLLEKRGAIYSDRPNMTFVNELLGWEASMPTMRYGTRFRKHRRLSQALLNSVASRNYTEMHEELAARLVSSLAAEPEKFHDQILTYATSTIFRLAYDLDITDDNQFIVHLVSDAVQKSLGFFKASGALVDVFPFLKWFYVYYPDSAPFSGFKKVIAEIREVVKKAHEVPYDMAKKMIRDRTSRNSLVLNAINNSGGLEGISAEDEKDIRGLAGILYGGEYMPVVPAIYLYSPTFSKVGQETTVGTLSSFILAMVRTREVQREAQAAIDAVVPRDRLPNLDDRPNIPYLDAVMKELFRWACPLVIALPHAVIQDDFYGGYFIPKGTSIVVSIYDMMNRCPRSTEFLPSRFIDGKDLGDVPSDPKEVIFGFGRRRCPGMYVAENSIWTAVAQMLSSFDIFPEIVDGKECIPPAKFLDEMIRHPAPFRCRIQPRSGFLCRRTGSDPP